RAHSPSGANGLFARANERNLGANARQSTANARFHGAVLPPPERLLEPPHRVAAAADVDRVRRLEAEVGAEFHQDVIPALDRDHGAAGALPDAEARRM